MILDHNTTAKVYYNSSDTNASMLEVAEALATDTRTWGSSLNARLITADEIAIITGNTEWNKSSEAYYLDSNNQTQVATSQGSSKYSWLFDYTNGCINNGCNKSDSTNYGYWTSSPVTIASIGAWGVYYGGRLISNYTDTLNAGLRPVITVSKSNL